MSYWMLEYIFVFRIQISTLCALQSCFPSWENYGFKGSDGFSPCVCILDWLNVKQTFPFQPCLWCAKRNGLFPVLLTFLLRVTSTVSDYMRFFSLFNENVIDFREPNQFGAQNTLFTVLGSFCPSFDRKYIEWTFSIRAIPHPYQNLCDIRFCIS